MQNQVDDNNPVELLNAMFDEKIQQLLEAGEREKATNYYYLRNMVMDSLEVRVMVGDLANLFNALLKLGTK